MGAFAAYGIARKLDLSPPMSLLLGLIWLFNISMRGIISVDFHGIIMVAALLIWVPLLMLNKRFVWAMILAFILMNFKEDATVYLGGLGVIMALSYKEKRWGWILAISAVVYYLIVHGILWRMISPSHLDYFAARFPNLIQPDKPPWLVVLSDPLLLIYPMLQWDRLWGFIAIFMPVLFLPFMRSGWLGLLPALWILFTMQLYSIHVFGGYYAGVVFTLILITAIPGLIKFCHAFPGRIQLIGWAMFGLLIGSWFFVHPEEGFSYFNPANLRAHHAAAIVQKVADATPADVSVSSDKFIGSYFSNRYTLRFFPDPENRLGERIYITNRSLCHPLTVLAIGSLGYKMLESNPYCLFLAKGEGSDASAEFMGKLRWIEAEDASITLWSTEPDKRASGGTAVHITPGSNYGGVIVNTNKVFLPPGDYSYTLRLKKSSRFQTNPKLPVAVNFLKPDGSEETLVATKLSVGEAVYNPEAYEDLQVPFSVNDTGLVYIRINFGYKFDIWWDGIALDGLDATFNEYYKSVFPAEITPAYASLAGTIKRLEEPKRGGSLLEVGNIDREVTVFSWEPGDELPAGNYWIYYSADAEEDGEMYFVWADLLKVSDNGGAPQVHTIMPLTFDRRGTNRDIQLNHSPALVALAPGDRLEIRAYPGLPVTMLLKGIWLMNPVVTDYLLYLR